MDEILAVHAAARQIAAYHPDGAVYFWERQQHSDVVIWVRDDSALDRPIGLSEDRFAALIEHHGLFIEIEAYR